MIYGNCRGHSFTMSFAAVPTDFIVHAARAYGMTALNRRFREDPGVQDVPTRHLGEHGKGAEERQAHEGGADRKTLAIVVVVLPTTSKQSVRPRTVSGRHKISAMLPALSEMGP